MNGVVALLAPCAPLRELAASFEEEGVPLLGAAGTGDPEALAREAAQRSALGLGIGGDAERLALILAGALGDAYIRSPTAEARAFGRAAARLAARRPLS